MSVAEIRNYIVANSETLVHASDAQIQQRTSAELIRRIVPGDAVTHDFRENRITLSCKPAAGEQQFDSDKGYKAPLLSTLK